MPRHVALLRGINVGGNNIIRMADLRATFEQMGFADVETYIQSGNVVFAAGTARADTLVSTIERALGSAFDYASRVVVVSGRQFEAVVAQAPAGFGKLPEKYRYDVIFVKAPLTPGKVLSQLPTRAGVDAVHAGRHALYSRRLIAKAEQSRLSKVAQLPFYQSMTVRNWNTTTRLLEMVKE